jgi:hypothetical protein
MEGIQKENLHTNINISLLYCLHSIFPKDNVTYSCYCLHLLINSDLTHVQVHLHSNIVAILEYLWVLQG